MKKVGFESRVKGEGVMDGESNLDENADLTCTWW